jgi:hypothetical protein
LEFKNKIKIHQDDAKVRMVKVLQYMVKENVVLVVVVRVAVL